MSDESQSIRENVKSLERIYKILSNDVGECMKRTIYLEEKLKALEEKVDVLQSSLHRYL